MGAAVSIIGHLGQQTSAESQRADRPPDSKTLLCFLRVGAGAGTIIGHKIQQTSQESQRKNPSVSERERIGIGRGRGRGEEEGKGRAVPRLGRHC